MGGSIRTPGVRDLFWWSAACAAQPVLYSVWATAWAKEIRPEDPLAGIVWLAMGLLILAIPPLVASAYWLALRRMAPRLSWWKWTLATVLSVGAWGGLILLLPQAVERTRPPAFLLVEAMLTLLPPVWVFARAAGMSFARPFLAAVAASAVVVAADAAFTHFGLHAFRHHPVWVAMNGWSRQERLAELWLRGGLGALWGLASGLFFCLRGPRTRPLVPAALALLAGVLLLAPLGAFVLAPFGWDKAVTWLRRTLSVAPATDVTQGENLLRFSHFAPVDLRPFGGAAFAPDSASFIARTAQGALVRVDSATGTVLGTLADDLQQDDGVAWTWSPDGRWLALQSSGEEVTVDRHYTRRQVRLRLYELPGYRLRGEYRQQGEGCYVGAPSTGLLFDADSQSLWYLCGHYWSAPPVGSPLALQLGLPDLQARALRRYDGSGPRQQARGLERVGDSLWTTELDALRTQLRVWDVARHRTVVLLPALRQAGGDFTLQEVQALTPEHVVLRYRDWQARVTRRLRFATATGELLARSDDPPDPAQPRGEPPPRESRIGGPGGWQLAARYTEVSKAGELRLLDAAGRERQRITGVAQWALAWSPDGRWVLLRPRDSGQLRIYRLAR